LPPDYRPTEKEEFMNQQMREYYRKKLLTWRAELLKESSETLHHLQEETVPEADVTDRASTETDRFRTSHARPRAQADRQDRFRVAPDRRRRLRLLRGYGRADRHQAPRRAPDRHAVDRSAGTPRAHGAHAARRLKAHGTGLAGLDPRRQRKARAAMSGLFSSNFRKPRYSAATAVGRTQGIYSRSLAVDSAIIA